MNIGIFSDTHDNIIQIKKARKIFEQEQIEVALFCGDLVSPFTLKYLQDFPWPIKAVFGNNEGDKWGIARRFKKYSITNIEYPQKGLIFTGVFDNKKIVVFHGHSNEITEALIQSGLYDVVCTGHTHEEKIKEIGRTLWINPGSVTGVSEKPEVTTGYVAVYNTVNNKAKLFPLV